MWKGRLPMEGAPYWYNTPIEDLDFEWTPEEKVEIERYCAKILKNIENEGGMTPKERWLATMYGKEKDRMMFGLNTANVYCSRVLDSYADAIKPIDLYRYPKLFIKAHMATVARFGTDFANMHAISYGEDMFGGQSKMIEYGNPILSGQPPIKSMEDLEGIIMPNPYTDGLYPGYLWAFREYKRILNEYNIPHPVWGCICVGPTLTVMMCMLGWTEFSMNSRKNPELVRKCMDISTEWLITYGKAVIDTYAPDGIYTCEVFDGFPLKGNEWIIDYHKKLGETLSQYSIEKTGKTVHLAYGYGFMGKALEAYELMYKHGGLGPAGKLFNGGYGGRGEVDLDAAAQWHYEHECYMSMSILDHTAEFGPISQVEEEIKELCEKHKHMPRFVPGFKSTYWTPMAHLDAAAAAFKKYGRYE